MFWHYSELRRSELAYTLCVNANMTERYLNDHLDSATIILSPGSFSKTPNSYSLTLLLYLCFMDCIAPYNRVRTSVMFFKRKCYVTLTIALTRSARNSLLVSLRSYQWPWSIHCLSSSMGGCAPYFSFAGMFRSSTNAMHFLPSGGPYTPLRRLKPNYIYFIFHLLIFSWYNNYTKAEQSQHHKIETPWANRVGKVVRRHL